MGGKPLRKLLILMMTAAVIAAGLIISPAAMAQPPKVTICHIPPGNPDNAHFITISIRALPAHLAHGDPPPGVAGPCEGQPPPPPPPPPPGPDRDRDRGGGGGGGAGGVGLETENESESGEVAMDFAVENTGDYASQCVPALQFGNSGNFNNAPSYLQYVSESGDFEPGGIEFAMEPEMAVDCANTVQQSSAASG